MAKKKHISIWLLEILKEYSDENHPLTAKSIQGILESRYDVNLERRTIYSNLDVLRQAGYKISEYDGKGTGYFLEKRQFDKGEVLLLCNAIHASHFISQKQSEKLIRTLLATQSKYSQKDFTDKVYMPNPQKTPDKNLMANIEIISEAIRDNKMLKFKYLKYGKNKKLVEKRPAPYIFEPRYIVYADSKAFMIATNEHHEDFTHFRIDKMASIVVLQDKARKLSKDMDAYEYARNKLFMYSGDMEYVTFRCDEKILDQMIDIFGTELGVMFDDSGFFTIHVKTSKTGALYLAQQFMEYIEVVEPEDLREQIKAHLKQAMKKYK